MWLLFYYEGCRASLLEGADRGCWVGPPEVQGHAGVHQESLVEGPAWCVFGVLVARLHAHEAPRHRPVLLRISGLPRHHGLLEGPLG
eukprot:4709220-Alexandrium_andersonii.AAC.1